MSAGQPINGLSEGSISTRRVSPTRLPMKICRSPTRHAWEEIQGAKKTVNEGSKKRIKEFFFLYALDGGGGGLHSDSHVSHGMPVRIHPKRQQAYLPCMESCQHVVERNAIHICTGSGSEEECLWVNDNKGGSIDLHGGV